MPEEKLGIDVRDIAAATEKRPEPEPAPEPVKKSEPEFLALKSTFIPSRGDMGGGFCVIFEGKTGKTVFQVFWLAKPFASGNTMIEPTKDWRNFVKRLPQLGPLDKDWGEKLQAQLKEILTSDEKRNLFENYTKVKIRQLESIIRRSFESATGCVFTAATEAEPIQRSELERAKVVKPLPPSPEELERQKREKAQREHEEQQEKEKEEANKDGTFEGTIIMCTPLVDPVKGKASSEITPGDIIGVKIEGEGTSALVKKYLEENNIEPLFPVDEIKETAGKKFLYVKISDEIRGAISITKDIKIKIKETAQQQKQDGGSLSFFGDIIFFGVLGIALIGLLLVLRYFFL